MREIIILGLERRKYMKAFIQLTVLVSLFFLFTVDAVALPISVGDRIEVDQMAWNARTSDRFLLMNYNTGDSYNAFCLEKGIFFEWDEMTVDSVGMVAVSGGNNNDPDPYGLGDPISQQTIWLYASYWEGYFGTHSVALMDQVQSAIWFAEDEYIAGANDYAIGQNAYRALVKNTTNFSVTGWDIQVVNPILGSKEMQSLLVGAPVPEPATMFLFGTGLIGLAASRLRKKKK